MKECSSSIFFICYYIFAGKTRLISRLKRVLETTGRKIVILLNIIRRIERYYCNRLLFFKAYVTCLLVIVDREWKWKRNSEASCQSTDTGRLLYKSIHISDIIHGMHDVDNLICKSIDLAFGFINRLITGSSVYESVSIAIGSFPCKSTPANISSRETRDNYRITIDL